MAQKRTRPSRRTPTAALEWLFETEWGAIRQLQTRVTDANLRDVRHRGASRRRQESVEAGLLRVTMVVRAIADLCIAKGVFSDEELRKQIDEADFADGVRDGGLDPELVAPGAQRLAKLKPLDPSIVKTAPRARLARKKKSGRTRQDR